MFANEAVWDRAARMLGGTLLLGIGLSGFVTSWLVGAALIVVGVMALATGIVGWCPGYTVCGIATRKVMAEHCPNCDRGVRGVPKDYR
jgi:hypothetical protein